MSDTPPRGLEWTLAPFGRILALSLAIVSLIVSLYVGYRYTGLVDCLRDQTLSAQQRTSALAAATDAEREADLALLKGGLDLIELQRASIAARQNTDKVRAAYPAPPVKPCK